MAIGKHLLFSALAMALLVVFPTQAQEPSPGQEVGEPTLEEKETARSLFREGDELYRGGDYAEALERFAAADEIMGLPTTKLERGRTLMKLGRLIEARDAFVQVGLLPLPPVEAEPQRLARQEAKALAEQLLGRIPKLIVEIRGVEDDTPVSLSVDGKDVARAAILHGLRVDPGKRLVRAEANGYITRERLVEVVEGQDRIVTMTMRLSHVEPPVARVPPPVAPVPAPPPPPSTSPWTIVGWAGVAVGTVGLTQGIVFGVLTMNSESELADACVDRVCPTSAQPAFDEARTLAHVSTASFVLAGVGAAVGITGLVLGAQDDDASDSALRWTIGPSGIGLTGAF